MREQRYKEVTRLLERGLTSREVALQTGLSYSYIRDLVTDPDGSKCRTRKDSYRGTCKTCGAKTDGSNGREQAPEYCAVHWARANAMYWTESRIVASIQEWHFLHGQTPAATDWNKPVEGSPGQYMKAPRHEWVGKRRWPPVSTVLRRFGSWANAIEAAGFPRPKRGSYRDESKRGVHLIRWHEQDIIDWIKAHAVDGIPPRSRGDGAPEKAAIRIFGGWGEAVEAAGFTPRRHRRRLARSTQR